MWQVLEWHNRAFFYQQSNGNGLLEEEEDEEEEDAPEKIPEQINQKAHINQVKQTVDLPGQHAPETRPWASGDQEAHRGVRYGVPCSANKQDDGGIEGIQLPKEETERLVKLWLLKCTAVSAEGRFLIIELQRLVGFLLVYFGNPFVSVFYQGKTFVGSNFSNVIIGYFSLSFSLVFSFTSLWALGNFDELLSKNVDA